MMSQNRPLILLKHRQLLLLAVLLLFLTAPIWMMLTHIASKAKEDYERQNMRYAKERLFEIPAPAVIYYNPEIGWNDDIYSSTNGIMEYLDSLFDHVSLTVIRVRALNENGIPQIISLNLEFIARNRGTYLLDKDIGNGYQNLRIIVQIDTSTGKIAKVLCTAKPTLDEKRMKQYEMSEVANWPSDYKSSLVTAITERCPDWINLKLQLRVMWDKDATRSKAYWSVDVHKRGTGSPGREIRCLWMLMDPVTGNIVSDTPGNIPFDTVVRDPTSAGDFHDRDFKSER